MKIHLIRHGELPPEYRGRYIGSTDAPLDAHALEACSALRKLSVRQIFCSPLRRARETAGLISAPCRFDARLAEIDFGRWEMLTFAEIAASTPKEKLDLWFHHTGKMSFPGGESVRDFHSRVDAAWREISAGTGLPVAIVTHGGVIMRILTLLTGASPEEQFSLAPPRGGMVTIEKNQGKWRYEHP